MKDLSDVICLVIDNGLFVEQAVTLARSYKKVYYCTPGGIQSAFPKLNNTQIGLGLDGIEVVRDVFGPHFDDIDIFCFPDIYYGNMQVFLEKLGKKVWGARLAEELELYREGCKSLMKAVELPLGGWAKVKGVHALREYLKEHPNQWVKIDAFRGTFETFFSKNYKLVEPRLDEVEYNLGAFKHDLDFIVEEDLPDKVEIGTDGYTIDGKYPSKLLTGIEIKDLAYIGVFGNYSDLPEPVTRFNSAMAGVFEEYRMRSWFAAECRIGEDQEPYMIDACMRSGSPPNELFQEFYTNFAEIVWAGANGILVDPDPIAKYGAEVLIHSPWADKNWQPIQIPPELRQFVKLRNATKIQGRDYVIPQAVGLPEIGAVVGWGDDLQSAADMCREIACHVEGYYVDIPIDALDKAQEQCDKMDEYGMKMF